MEWEAKSVGDWDAAIRGSSALRAALLSHVHDEIALYQELERGAILYDMAKFYDNIDICLLCAEAMRCGYPAMMLALGMQMHMALRGLKAYNTHPGYTMQKK